MRKLLLGIVVVVVLAISVQIQAQTDEVELILEQGLNGYEGTRDTTLYQDPENSNGAGQHIFAGNAGSRNPRRALIEFDLSEIPEGATITSVTLQLVVSRTITQASDQTLHRLTKDWGEGEVDAGAQEGTGAAPQENDATWTFNFFGTSEWDNPGGDFIEEASAVATVGGNRSVVQWTGEGLVSDVQAWLDGESENFGWILIGDESPFNSAKRFNSSNNDAVDEGQRPRLTITYTSSSK